MRTLVGRDRWHGPDGSIVRGIALLSLMAAIALLAACSGNGTKPGHSTARAPVATVGVEPIDSTTGGSGSAASPKPGSVPPGTVALFDMQAQSVTKLDLGRSLIMADWVDDGKTLVALDVNAMHWIAIGIEGTLVHDLGAVPQPTGEAGLPYAASPVHDGRRVTMINLSSTPSAEMVDVLTGDRERLPTGMALASFAPGGTQLAGAVWPLDSDGHADPAKARAGVFERGGDCGASYCMSWDFPTGDGLLRRPGGLPRSEPWSPDGTKLLLTASAPCPASSHTPVAQTPCLPDRTAEVYSWPGHRLLLSVPLGDAGDARWSGNNALYVRGRPNTQLDASEYLVTMDATRTALPPSLHGCCISFSPDGKYAVANAVPGEACSLFDVASGAVIAGVPKGAGDTNDTGICQYVRWTADGRYAIATGVNTP